jgi:putative zinc finger/helix-turn-helix YgiT family protein
MPRPYPWKCRSCGKQEVRPAIVDYSTEMEHDGRSYSLTVPNLTILECANCHNRNLPDEAFARVVGELRAKADLLTPEMIRAERKRLALTQEMLANLLGVAKETVSRWETGGQIQQRVMNDFLKAFFALPELRDYLREERAGATRRARSAQTTTSTEVAEPLNAEPPKRNPSQPA